MNFVIVGSGRCGTSFIRDVFNRHPDCFVCSESYWHAALLAKYGDERAPADRLIGDLLSVRFHDGRSTLEANLALLGVGTGVFLERVARHVAARNADVRSVCQAVEAVFLSVAGKSVFADKTPHYGYHLAELRHLWPGLKIIHIVRDGRPCAASMRLHGGYQLLAALGVDDWTQIAAIAAQLRPVPAVADPSRYLEMWARQVTRMAGAGRMLPAGAYREFRYERMLARPAAFLAELAAFAGLAPDEAWLTASAAEVSAPAGGVLEDYGVSDFASWALGRFDSGGDAGGVGR